MKHLYPQSHPRHINNFYRFFIILKFYYWITAYFVIKIIDMLLWFIPIITFCIKNCHNCLSIIDIWIMFDKINTFIMSLFLNNSCNLANIVDETCVDITMLSMVEIHLIEWYHLDKWHKFLQLLQLSQMQKISRRELWNKTNKQLWKQLKV